MKISSVKHRITLLNMLLLAIIMVFFIFISTVYIRAFLLADIDKRLNFSAERYKDFLHRTGRTSNSIGFRQQRSHFRNDFLPGVYFDESGKVLFPEELSEDLTVPLVKSSFEIAVKGDKSFSDAVYNEIKYRVLYVPITIDKDLGKLSETKGVIQLAQSTAEADALLRALTAALVVLIPIALVLAGIAGYLTTSNIMRPIKNMTYAAEEINDTDLSKRLPVEGGDEFAKLAVTMNGMLARLETSFSDLKLAFEREQRFASDASHELRTPLTVIKAGVSLALGKNRTGEYYQKVLKDIEFSTDFMSSLVEDLLVIARSENGSLSLNMEEIKSGDLFEKAVSLTEHLARQKNITLDISGKDVAVYCDLKYFVRVIVNILTNSIRHTAENGLISLNAKAEEDNTVISVADNGEGIAEEHILHLAKRFYRVDTSRNKKSGGSGLGLSICKSIVELHKGDLKIESEIGKGTTVMIRLNSGS